MHLFISRACDRGLPLPAYPDRAARGLERWRAAADDTGEGRLSDMARTAAVDPAGHRLLNAVFGNSPYLSQICVGDPGFSCDLLHGGPDAAFERVMGNLDGTRREELGRDRLATLLRTAKRRVALTVALADIAGAWDLNRVTGALSEFAEAALRLASGHVLGAAAGAGAFRLAESGYPEKDSGLVVLGMGKLGGRELNYSSDIDLIVLYDTDRIQGGDADSLQGHFVRLTRDLVRLMEERTVEGYVFRSDLRLRPDPGSTPLAISVLAALTYYESIGQNWERAALIKARPVAGDIEAGDAFLERLSPFIWRKNLDFAAIRDIHSIKRQINAAKGGAKIAVAGHNIKLGRGGIREIEFFVQTQQLIWGGREPSLRHPATIQSLRSLAESGRIAEDTAADMTDAYRFLRRVEHRLQMINDEQTHTLPADGEGLGALAVFLGYADEGAFAHDLTCHLRRVETHYAELFEDAPALSVPGTGNLVFTGNDADPDTLETLGRLGFEKPDTVDAVVRDWHHGHYRVTHCTRARELLTELMPALLEALARTARPDDAFLMFDEFLSRLPVGVQLFSMIYSKPPLLDLIFVYSSGEGASIGPEPLPASQYFARLSQRLINALTAQTTEGALYEVDMRLRPSGNAGPLATSLDAFVAYQRKSAWTWEHQGMLQLSLEDAGDPIPEGLQPTLSKLGGASDFEDLRELMRATAGSVHGHFRDLIEIPAGSKS